MVYNILNENNPIWKTVEFQVIGPYINNVKNKSQIKISNRNIPRFSFFNKK